MWRNQLVGDILADSRMVTVAEVGPGGCLVVCVLQPHPARQLQARSK